MNLYICGNGFDLHLDMPTGYKDYKAFLEKHHRETVFDFEYYTKIGDTNSFCWSDIERALDIDLVPIIENCLFETDYQEPEIHFNFMNYSSFDRYLDDERLFSRKNELRNRLKQLIGFIDNFTAVYFMEWLCSIDYKKYSPDLSLNLQPDDIYITFNYLDSLEKIYGIPDNRILHVHGSLSKLGSISKIESMCQRIIDENGRVSLDENIEMLSSMVINEIRRELQFGAARNPNQESNRIYALFKANPKYKDEISIVDTTIDNSSKYLPNNYHALKTFLSPSQILKIDNVVVMGHSINGVDYPYYKDVLIELLKDKKWIFYYHSDSHSEEDRFIKSLKIENYSFVKW